MTDLTLRDRIRRILPRWLRGGDVGAVLYAIATMADALGDAARRGTLKRYPMVGSEDALTAIGRDRRISRGRNEPDASYMVRLRRWLTDHRVRGNPYALLEQLRAHYASTPFDIELHYYGSGVAEFTMPAGGVITRGLAAWMPDSQPAKWARWWLIYAWPEPVIADGLWSDPGTWSDGGVWDSDLTAQEVADIRLVPRQWGNAHSRGRVRLVDSLGASIELSVD